jgi:subtilisin family serine protease
MSSFFCNIGPTLLCSMVGRALSMTRRLTGAWFAVAVFGAIAPATAAAESVIVKCTRPCTAAIAAIERNGGTVTHRYRFVDAIAAEAPRPALNVVRGLLPAGAVRKDHVVAQPSAARDRNGTSMVASVGANAATALDAAEVAKRAVQQPNAYLLNDALMNLGPVFAGGFTGNGVKVAVIDTGIRPGRPHISLDGSVIGGESLVSDGLGFSHENNIGHGTFVAGMISANVVFSFAPTSPVLQSLQVHCPSCIGPGATQVAMLGSAPGSSIYAVKIFASSGEGAPTSRVIAAMERVLTLRENFDNGMPETPNADGSFSALNIAVCNMSLGGSTLWAGREIMDEVTNAFLDRNIVLVTSI